MGTLPSKLFRRLFDHEYRSPQEEEEEEEEEAIPFKERTFQFQNLIAIALLASIATFALILALFWWYFATEKEGFVPNFPYDTKYVWRENDHFLFWPDAEEQWEGLMPHDKGFVEVPDPKRVGLTGGFPLNQSTIVDNLGRPVKSQPKSTNSEAYGLTVFHQLRCLSQMRTAYLESNIHFRHTTWKSSPFIHTMHCYDYLRQAVMCAADMTLEKVVVSPEKGGRVGWRVDGWREVHTCRNWEGVLRWVEGHGVSSGRGGVKVVGGGWEGKVGEGQEGDD